MARTLSCVTLFILMTSTAFADVPSSFNVQGRLVNNAGLAVDGNYVLTFSIFAKETGGSALWTETVLDVVVSGGVFSVELGTKDNLGPALQAANDNPWIEVKVAGESPLKRQPIRSVPFAMKAMAANKLSCTDCIDPSHTSFMSGCKAGQVLKFQNNKWGCADDTDTNATYSGKNFAISNQLCPSGQVLVGIGKDGLKVCKEDKDTNNTYSGKNFAISNQSCPSGQVLTGFDSNGKIKCSSSVLRDYVNKNCYIYFGHRDNCSSCTSTPSKRGYVNGDGTCKNVSGGGNNCQTSSFGSGHSSIRLFGLVTSGDVDDNDKFYVGMKCK